MKKLERVLHVDDDPSIRIIARVALEKVGKFALLSCASGKDTLEQALEFQPQVILLDVMMPGMDGPSTLAELKKLLDLSGVPVIFMTAKVQPEELEKYREMGAFDVIVKPFAPMQLAQDIRQLWSDFHKI